jgi:hypothetical protein
VVVGGQERLAEGAPVAVTLVNRRPAGGRESVGGTAADTAQSRTDTAVAQGSEAGESQGR